MASYLNGRLPATMLGRVPGTSALCPLEFIPQVSALRAAFHAEFGVPLKITDGYRPYEGNYYAQVETMLRNYKPAGEFRRIAPGASLNGRKYHDWNGVRRYLLPGKPQVAFPGKSNHGRPDRPAIDFGSRVNVMDSREHKWMVANAPRFGFVWPSWARGAREGWHFEGARLVRVSNTITTPSGSIPTPTGDLPAGLTRKEPTEMARLVQHSNNRDFAIVGPGAQFTTLGTINQLHTAVGLGMVDGITLEVDGKGQTDVRGDIELLDPLMWDTAVEIGRRFRDQNVR